MISLLDAVTERAAAAPPVGAPAFFALSCGGVPIALPLLRADVFLAADRPDRLEAAFLAAPWRAAAGSAIRPGAEVRLRLAGGQVFAGIAERAARRSERRSGRTIEVVACARYHSLRAARPAAVYYQSTDSEIAQRIARDLELVAVTEPSERIHRRLEQSGDPLRFLRRLAREIGFGLAVAGGKLYFGKDVPAGGECYFVNGSRALVSFEEIDSAEGRERRASMVIAGDARLRPLARVCMARDPAAAPADGAERLAFRVLHAVDAGGFTTTAHLVSRGGALAGESAR